MTSGWIALLDDLATLTKVAASSLDDAGAQAAKAGSKAAGRALVIVVIAVMVGSGKGCYRKQYPMAPMNTITVKALNR